MVAVAPLKYRGQMFMLEKSDYRNSGQVITSLYFANRQSSSPKLGLAILK